MEITGLNEEIWHYSGAYISFVLRIKEAIESKENNIYIEVPDEKSFTRIKSDLLSIIDDIEKTYVIKFNENIISLLRYIQT